jgi:hypothetical protein
MKDMIIEAARHAKAWAIPFVLMAGQAAPKWSLQRITEAVIIAVIVGGIGSAATYAIMIPRLDQQMIDFKQFVAIEMDGLKGEVGKNADDIKDMRHDLYRPSK